MERRAEGDSPNDGNLVEREGEQIQAQVGKKAECILEDYGFNTDGSLTDQEKARSLIEHTDVTLDHKVVCHMIEELNRGQAKEKRIDFCQLHETFEDPSSVKAHVSIDDVCCKKQKASGRKKGSPPPKEKREMVYNTVAHIKNKESKTYMLNTSTIQQMMIIVLAFLLSNGLLSKPGSTSIFYRWGPKSVCSDQEHLSFPSKSSWTGSIWKRNVKTS